MPSRRTMQDRLFPELQRIGQPERRRLFRAANYRVWRTWRAWLFFVGYLVVMVVVAGAFPRYARGLPISPSMISGILGGLIGGTTGLVLNLAFRRPIRRYLRESLIARGVPICLKCGYDLRGQTEPRCPECGAACDPRLIRDRPHNRPPTI